MVNKRTFIKFDTGRDYFFIGIFGKPGEGARFAKIKGEETKGEDSRKTVAAAACCYSQLESRQIGEKLAKGGEILFAKQTGKTTMAKLLLKRKRERETTTGKKEEPAIGQPKKEEPVPSFPFPPPLSPNGLVKFQQEQKTPPPPSEEA